jgi:hypothetical protein
MAEKDCKEMNGWEKVWAVTKTSVGYAGVIVWGIAKWLLDGASRIKYSDGSRCIGQKSYPPGYGGSVHTVGGGGKKPGSWSSGRHR